MNKALGILYALLVGAFVALLLVYSAMAATLLPNGEQQFFDANGNPLAGGRVYFYVPNTTTQKNTWQDSAESILNTNPVQLDAAGRAIIYGTGSYRQIVKDSLGNVVWDQLTTDTATAAGVSWAGTGAGSANAQTVTSAGFNQTDGQVIYFIAGATNTGATTLSVNSGTPIAIYKDLPAGSTALTGGEIASGTTVGVVYNAGTGRFHLITNNSQGFSLKTQVPSGGTVDLGAVASHVVEVTGSGQTITSFGNGGANASRGSIYFVTFTGDTIIQYGGSLLTPTYSNLHASSGDVLTVLFLGGSSWQVLSLQEGSSGVLIPNYQTGTTYVVNSGDDGKVIRLSNASGVTVSVPGPTGSFGYGFRFTVQNDSAAGMVTLYPASGTIGGAASFVLPPYNGVTFQSDGVNWMPVGPVPWATQRVLLAEQSAVSSSEIDFPTVFAAPYNNFEIEFDDLVAAANGDICRLQVFSGGTYQISGYSYVIWGSNFSSNPVTTSSAASSYIPCSNAAQLKAAEPGTYGTMKVFSPQYTNTKVKTFWGQFSSADNSGTFGQSVISGFWPYGYAMTGFRVLFNTGNITSGKVRVYGYR